MEDGTAFDREWRGNASATNINNQRTRSMVCALGLLQLQKTSLTHTLDKTTGEVSLFVVISFLF